MSPPFIIAAVIFLFSVITSVNSLGGAASTLAVSYGDSNTVCGIVAEQQKQRIQCWRKNRTVNILPETSFESIAGGRNIFCGVRSGGYSLICWNSTFVPKRIYYSKNVLLKNLTVGDDQICALSDNGAPNLKCWRDDDVLAKLPDKAAKFSGISAGLGFSCGVLMNDNSVTCWGGNDGNDTVSNFIENEFVGLKILSIVVGGEFACGFNLSGFLVCKGRNDSGQLNVPLSNLGYEYEYNAVALGFNHGCGIRRINSSVVCWGGNGGFSSNVTDGVSFVSIVAGFNFTCGLTASNFSVICWGPGWDNSSYSLGVELSLPKILPGPCVESKCECGLYPQSETLCSGSGNICRSCDLLESFPPVSSPVVYIPSPSSPSKDLKKGFLVLAIVGCVGGLLAICTGIYLLWTGACFGHKKVHSSVQPTITRNSSNAQQSSNNSPPSRSSTIRRQGSRVWGRQRSGTSGMFSRQRSGTSTKHTDRAEEFTFADLVAATNSFSLENKIGSGSFGIVYKGKLPDGREVAIKRGETGTKLKKFQEKKSAFDSELSFLSRLHHKHLPDRDYKPMKAVGTVGYIDPEYYGLNVLTAKSDVYGLGIVLLELLTGKRAIFKSEENEGTPISVVDFAVPLIMGGELMKILDPRVGQPELNEAEAVELVAYTAMHCVNLEGIDRPTMTDIVANLERALALCDDSYGSISSGPISIISQ
ncbi:putative serine/threonine-protein kinase-like protein CCR3 [Heracleum sosnowskyi]|uniref:Serine/threonine-protein kinase-like protein CCR3 n=1 Tax=Heracleum sosnowskyi TaxID=360622 RepID=A0AAD8M8Y3_9APIA|nr:putative serine/threonine-protein kinase-like protein CCR3 [Heracleum sosnowskyi]